MAWAQHCMIAAGLLHSHQMEGETESHAVTWTSRNLCSAPGLLTDLLYGKKPQLCTVPVCVQYFSLLSCIEARRVIWGKPLKILYCEDFPATSNVNDGHQQLVWLYNWLLFEVCSLSVAFKFCIISRKHAFRACSYHYSKGPAETLLKLSLLFLFGFFLGWKVKQI